MTSPDSGASATHAPTPSGRLERAIGLPYATAMVVGTIIGASIFMQPSEVTGQIPSIPGVFAVWAAAGLLTLFGALVCAELASIHTGSGGVYVFLRDIFSPLVGFLWGWGMFWVMHSGIIAIVSVICARYLAFFVPLDDAGIRLAAVAVIVVLSAVNYRGVALGSALQASFTLGKLVAVAGMIVLGLAFGSRVPEHFVGGGPFLEVTTGRDFALALVAGLFAFGGWHMVTYNAGETRDPARTVPRALILGTLIVTASYMALTAVYLYVLPLETVAASTRVAADAAEVLFGYWGGAAMAALVVFSTFGAVSGIVLAGPRVYHAMARDGLFPRSAAAVHPRFHTPHRAIVLQGAWASTLVFTGTYAALFRRVIYTEWIFFGLLGVGLMVLRRRGIQGRYRLPGYPLVPLVFALSAFAIVLNELLAEPGQGAVGLAVVLLGVPVYWVFVRLRSRTESVSVPDTASTP